jgi:drug/metabolite transporter (DMT)-like permease
VRVTEAPASPSPHRAPPTAARSVPRSLPLVLLTAILGISVSGPLAKLSAAHPLAIASWRLGIALAIVAGFLAATGTWREWRTLSRRDLGIALGAGCLLALHFWSWITSLALTSVAASVVLVNLHPMVIVAGSALWLGERPTRRQLAGIGIALVGAVIIGYGDLRAELGTAVVDAALAAAAREGTGHGPLMGDLLAVLGAVTVGLYYLVGRSLRQRLSLWPYVGLVYAACLVSLLALAAMTGAPLWPQPPRELLIFAGIAIGPMMLGHTGFNWSLRYVPAYVVSLAVLAEPVGATMLAALLPGIGEIPGVWTLAGGAVILAGLGLGTAERRAR